MRRSRRSPSRYRSPPISTPPSTRCGRTSRASGTRRSTSASLDGPATVDRPRRGVRRPRGRAPRARASAPRPPAAARARRLDVSRKRKPSKRRPRRRRRTLVVLAIAIPLAVLAVTAAGGAVYFGSSCDLSALRPVRQADNSLVYGANGSLIGVLPAVENRTAVARDAISPWMPKATVAIEDRRFYEHGGIDPVGILRALVADVSAGHIVQGGSTITQELVRNLYLSREQDAATEGRRGLPRRQARARLVEGQDPHRLSQRRLLREPRLRDRGRGRDVLLRSGEPPDARAGCAPRGASAGSVLLRPAPQSGRRPRRRDDVLRALRRSGDITDAQYAAAVHDPQPPPAPEPGVCEPGAVLRRLRREPPAAGVRRGDRPRGRAEDLHDDPAASATRRRARAVGGAAGRHDPAGAIVSHRSRDRRDPRDGGGDARNARQ